MGSVLRLIKFVSDWLKPLGAICLFGMMALTCVDVVGRFFRHPILGTVELVTFMGIFAVGFALPDTHDNKGHIGVEILMRRFSGKTQLVVEFITELIGLAFFALMTRQMFIYGLKMRESGEVSINLELPEYIIVLILSFCFAIFCLIMVKRLVEIVYSLSNK